jgi:hypothetical protein
VKIPALAKEIIDELEAQKPGETKGRLQIGVGRNLEQPVILNRQTVPATEWTNLANGWRSWSLKVELPGALGMRLHLEDVSLPKGIRIVVYDPSKTDTNASPITAESLGGQRELWTETRFCDSVMVECQAAPGVDTALASFTLRELSHIYTIPSSAGNHKAAIGSCDNDVTCFPEWSAQAAGVARLSYVDGGGTYLCTGCLLATTDPSPRDFFLTAHHCITSQRTASTLELYWLYQTSVCNGDPPGILSVPHTSGGADLVAASLLSDFTLLRLHQAAPPGTTHLTWSTSSPSDGEVLVGIHHPDGQFKRLSQGQYIGSDIYFWHVQWFSGVTEPGSSGSPLFNANHEVIGQLTGGFNGPGSSCDNPSAPDEYGRFDVTFPLVKPWIGMGFGSNGFVPLKAVYDGLFFDTAGGVDPATSGSFVLATTSKGRFSGKMQSGSGRYSFTGELDANGGGEARINRGPQRGWTLQIQIDPAAGDTVTGTVGDGNWTAELAGNRAVFDGKTGIAPQQGLYTMMILGSHGSTTEPGGDSYGTLRVDAAGRVRVAGALSDGTRFSQVATVSKDGAWPLYVPFSSGQGSLFGWLTFASDGSQDLVGDVTWTKPAVPRAKYYEPGFKVRTSAMGTIYSAPPKGVPIMNLSTGMLTLDGGNLTQSISDPIAIGANSRVTDLGGNKLSLTFSLDTGLLRGRITDPATSKTKSFGGVVLQKQNSAVGCFLGTTESGWVKLTP